MTCFVQSMWVPDAIGVAYSNSSNDVARIDKFEARNNDAATQTITIHVVGNGFAPDDSSIRLTKAIASGETDLCHALVGHDLDPGDTIYVLATLADAISIRAGGRYVE